MEMSRMPGPSKGTRDGADDNRYLNGSALSAHYAHVKVGYPRSSGCGFCTEGLGAVVTVDERPIWNPDSMVPDTGSDEEGTTPPPSLDDRLGRLEDELYGAAE